MTRVSLARAGAGYAGLAPPFGPGRAYPEIERLLGPEAARGPANPVYAALRAALLGLGLDRERFGSGDWNPFGALVGRGGRVVLKPNFIRHWNPCEEGTLESVVTHGAVLRAAADYAFLAVGPEGSVEVAEAPQHDCDFEAIRASLHLDAIAALYERVLRRELPLLDLRPEAVTYRDGVIASRCRLPGDPRGYRVVDLGERSAFHGSGLDPRRFRGADYDPGPTSEHHLDGRNEYLLSESVLSADLVVNLPKLKTHKKTGVTLALKNLVGINGDKNWLPHHCAGPVHRGGDEYPGRRWLDGARSFASDVARGWLQRGWGTRLARWVRRAEDAARGPGFIRSGNWYGNRTTWRMCVDLNRCLYYSDAKGLHLDAPSPVRRVLTILDGVVAGEGEGPLAPADVPLGLLLAALDPVALDLAAVRLMGFDEARIPKIRACLDATELPLTSVRDPAEVTVVEVDPGAFTARERPLAALRPERPFRAHPGWRGHLERAGP